MGRVFKGKEVGTNQEVAIKVLFKELTENNKVVEREQQNAQIRISHKNLINQLDFIVSKGIYHTVSSYFKGAPLDEYIEQHNQEGGIEHDKVVIIAKQIFQGLKALHENVPKIIHRDIKPSNVLIDPISMEVKILDFGIAKITGDNRKSKTGLGTIMGSVYYSPPEQIKGRHNLVDERADIYSAAILIYELFTGEVPFEGSEFEIMQQQVTDLLPRHEKISEYMFPSTFKGQC